MVPDFLGTSRRPLGRRSLNENRLRGDGKSPTVDDYWTEAHTLRAAAIHAWIRADRRDQNYLNKQADRFASVARRIQWQIDRNVRSS